MNRQTVLKHLNAKVLNQFDDAFKFFASNVDLGEYTLDRATRMTARNVSGLTYNKRDNRFSNSRGTTGFNPETGEGHSYGWYALTRIIKGKLVLNDYRYSQQTSIHIKRVREVLRDLGLEFMTIEAPLGLQDLDAALKYELNNQAKRYINAKYRRDKATNSELNRLISLKGPAFKKLAQLGKTATLTQLEIAIATAENARLARLERERAERAMKKAMSLIQIISDRQGAMHDQTDGKHLVETAQWCWNVDNVFQSKVSDYELRDAVRRGFTKIYVHGAERQHLRLVQG